MKCSYRPFGVTYRQEGKDLEHEVNQWLWGFLNIFDVKIVATVDPTTEPGRRADIDLHVFVLYEKIKV